MLLVLAKEVGMRGQIWGVNMVKICDTYSEIVIMKVIISINESRLMHFNIVPFYWDELGECYIEVKLSYMMHILYPLSSGRLFIVLTYFSF